MSADSIQGEFNIKRFCTEEFLRMCLIWTILNKRHKRHFIFRLRCKGENEDSLEKIFHASYLLSAVAYRLHGGGEKNQFSHEKKNLNKQDFLQWDKDTESDPHTILKQVFFFVFLAIRISM